MSYFECVYLKVELKTKTNLVCMIKLVVIPLKIYDYLITAIIKAHKFKNSLCRFILMFNEKINTLH